jgi:hypothetical protein
MEMDKTCVLLIYLNFVCMPTSTNANDEKTLWDKSWRFWRFWGGIV